MSVDLLLVDWLGRGGIAQTSDSFRRAAIDAGLDVCLLSRSGQTLSTDEAEEMTRSGVIGILDVHRRLVRRAVRIIESRRPRTVYLQNYWLPTMERSVADACERYGSRLILAMHNHRPHQLRSGTRVGLGGLVRSADRIVVHSEYVARMAAGQVTGSPVLIEHPVQTGLLEQPAVPIAELSAIAEHAHVALRFGVLERRYKAPQSLLSLGAELGTEWVIAAGGVGSSSVGAALSADRFLSEGELRWLVERASVSLLPYKSATQSGAVVLAQALGAPPVVTGVGGIPEQVEDGVTGVLMRPDASLQEWAEVLRRIELEPEWWSDVARNAREAAWLRHRRGVDRWLELVTDR